MGCRADGVQIRRRCRTDRDLRRRVLDAGRLPGADDHPQCREGARFPQALSVVLLLWMLPFIWIGVVLSVRRALDARIFPGVVVAFFVPFVNHVLMAALVLA